MSSSDSESISDWTILLSSLSLSSLSPSLFSMSLPDVSSSGKDKLYVRNLEENNIITISGKIHL